jgi:hypothetical protein
MYLMTDRVTSPIAIIPRGTVTNQRIFFASLELIGFNSVSTFLQPRVNTHPPS